eukprot:SAG31_NODE_8046_length_1534_cov_1.428571_3_plen_127_part_01
MNVVNCRVRYLRTAEAVASEQYALCKDLQAQSDELDKKKDIAEAVLDDAGIVPEVPVPKQVVESGMKRFEEMYNSGDYEKCGTCYADECEVSVNGGSAAGGYGPFKTPAEVAGFLKDLKEEFGATDM